MSSLPPPADSQSAPTLERTSLGDEEAGAGAASSDPLALLTPAGFRSNPLPEPWRTAAVLGLLLCGFWMIYFHLGLSMETHGTLRNNMFFHSDIGRVIHDITRADVSHGRTLVHPLFVLVTQPVGSGLNRLIGSPSRAALTLNSFMGGATVALTCLFFLLCRVSLRRSLLGALLLGFSASHLYFGSAPETFIFSCLGIILLVMGLAREPRRWRYFLAAGVFSMGILVTNLAFVLITYAAAVAQAGWWRGARRVALLTAGVVAVTMLLSYVQKAIWPTSALFFQPQLVATSEKRFTPDYSTVSKVLQREGSLLRYVFVYDFFAPKTYVDRAIQTRAALQMHNRSLAYIPMWGKVATGLWLILLLGALWRTASSPSARRPLPIGLILCVLYNLFLHTLYGDDLFLYSCNSCFCLVAWMVLSVSDWKTPCLATIIDWTLSVLVAFEAVNNVFFAKALAEMRYVPA